MVVWPLDQTLVAILVAKEVVDPLKVAVVGDAKSSSLPEVTDVVSMGLLAVNWGVIISCDPYDVDATAGGAFDVTVVRLAVGPRLFDGEVGRKVLEMIFVLVDVGDVEVLRGDSDVP